MKVKNELILKFDLDKESAIEIVKIIRQIYILLQINHLSQTNQNRS